MLGRGEFLCNVFALLAATKGHADVGWEAVEGINESSSLCFLNVSVLGKPKGNESKDSDLRSEGLGTGNGVLATSIQVNSAICGPEN